VSPISCRFRVFLNQFEESANRQDFDAAVCAQRKQVLIPGNDGLGPSVHGEEKELIVSGIFADDGGMQANGHGFDIRQDALRDKILDFLPG
jgi:hypothetical protein